MLLWALRLHLSTFDTSPRIPIVNLGYCETRGNQIEFPVDGAEFSGTQDLVSRRSIAAGIGGRHRDHGGAPSLWVHGRRVKIRARRSRNGTMPWSPWKSYIFAIDPSNAEDYSVFGFVFVGQFGQGPGASALTIDANRIGHFFYSPAQGRDGEEWVSLFAY
jgi:hypothetical protein